jgi:hypothetical protein
MGRWSKPVTTKHKAVRNRPGMHTQMQGGYKSLANEHFPPRIDRNAFGGNVIINQASVVIQV